MLCVFVLLRSLSLWQLVRTVVWEDTVQQLKTFICRASWVERRVRRASSASTTLPPPFLYKNSIRALPLAFERRPLKIKSDFSNHSHTLLYIFVLYQTPMLPLFSVHQRRTSFVPWLPASIIENANTLCEKRSRNQGKQINPSQRVETDADFFALWCSFMTPMTSDVKRWHWQSLLQVLKKTRWA